MRKGKEKKIIPRLCSLGEYSVRTGKTPQQHKSHIHDIATGEVNPAQQQPSDPAATDPALVRPAWPGQRIEANRGEWSRGGGMSVGWGRNARVSHCIALPEFIPATALPRPCRGARKDKIVLSLGRVTFQFLQATLCPFCPFWSLF